MQFSLVVAAYNVARYLPDFLGSLEKQTLAPGEFEVILVDDGSTDETLQELRAWAARTSLSATVLTKENGGQSSARNLGLDHARGQWVTFPDPDDLLRPAYLEKVAALLGRHLDLDLVATNRVMMDDATGEVTDTHPLRWMFRDGDSVRDLVRDTTYFHGSAPAAFYRRDVLAETGLRFSELVRPNFEDGHFSSHYLLGFPRPRVGFVPSAKYVYRKRSDASSTLQTSLTDPRRYLDVLRHGYLDVLAAGARKYDEPPAWLQNFVVYELSYYFSAYVNSNGAARAPADLLDDYHDLLAEILQRLDPALVAVSEQPGLEPEWRLMMLHSYQPEPWVEEEATIVALDRPQGLLQLSYYFTGEQPDEEIEIGGQVVEPVHAKTREILSHERVLLRERLLWVRVAPAVHLRLDGRAWPVRVQRPEPPRSAARRAVAVRIDPATGDVGQRAWSAYTDEELQLLGDAAGPAARRKYAEAWVFMDRVHDADDSGEHLFRWVRQHRPDVNAWFVLEQGTASWKRLRKAGFGRRMVGYGTREWKLLLLNAVHLASSHADEAIVNPPDLAFAPTRPRFAFLQHGVIKDDLSRWLNPKPIGTFVTSTRGEYDSIAGEGNAYRYSTRETVLTGLPRFDLVREAGLAVPEEQRDLVLVAPTWRQWLVKRLARASQRREAADDFLHSEFVEQWLAFVHSDELRAVIDQQGLRLAMLPHPNLAAMVPMLDLPSSVEVFEFDDVDVRQLFARAAVLVTDYSSMAFNAAYIDRPVVYYQFDRERVLGGDHVGRAGYFDYERDGFGPVARDCAAAVTATTRALAHGRAPAAPYDERIAATFGLRDGGCRERVFDAIVASGSRHRA